LTAQEYLNNLAYLTAQGSNSLGAESLAAGLVTILSRVIAVAAKGQQPLAVPLVEIVRDQLDHEVVGSLRLYANS
jgi:hypothetical protein